MEDPMPGAMRRMGVYLGLVEDDDWDDADYGHLDGRDARMVERAPHRDDYSEARLSREHSFARHGDPRHGEARGDVATMVRERDYRMDEFTQIVDDAPSYQITTLHPRTYNEARTIGEHFRKNTPVIMNLSEMDDADAKRLVDFAAGLTFGLHGRIERVTAKVFLLSPHNVTVTAADKARIVETGFFNQS
jgi:cell division inhibitor SepF